MKVVMILKMNFYMRVNLLTVINMVLEDYIVLLVHIIMLIGNIINLLETLYNILLKEINGD